MPTVDVVNLQKQKVGTLDLSDAVFGAAEAKPLVHAAVVMQRASERQGTASTLRRGEVSGSGKKPWKQKHTGRARAGSIRSPIWRHGGSVFGPKPRDYGYRIPKRQYKAALQSALSARAAEGAITVVRDLRLSEPKTKLMAKALRDLGVGSPILMVLEGEDGVIQRAARNLPAVKVMNAEGLNVYDVLRYKSIIMTEQVAALVQERWA